MTTALYRRYRPETFGEMIGQSQVTDPLMTALRGDRVGHAYLFSGPRGCGKTTSARILARCLNCAEGPTDTPCGTCPSCVELSRAGGGSLDVVEIDAASHNGVDDARDLRERATFAPSRDRFKIFILDEAHMVTPQGFNALLKLVEEPPPHVKFIFATTEPEKVLGTIRSRTHHYPFRLVPPAAMLEYVEKLCAEEGVIVEQGVLPLVVRAGGGSPRDTLSLLDQLIAGSDAPAGSETVTVGYARAVALLGYTHGALLDEIVDALAAGDAATAFPAIDRVVQTGQDPRRFVDDLLERLRDLIVIAAVGSGASAVLRGIAEDELDRMRRQAESFGAARLSRTADVVSAALDDMSGATSPRLHLELMVARVLAAAPGGSAASGTAASGALHPPATTHPPVVPPATATPSPTVASDTGRTPAPAAPSTPAASAPSAPTAPADAPEPAPAPEPERTPEPEITPESGHAPEPQPAPTPSPQSSSAPSAPVTFERVRDAWPAVLKRLEGISRTSWLLATAVQPLAYDGDSEVLTLGFTSQHDVAKFKGTTPGSGPSDHLRTAIEQEVGVRVKYLPAPMPPGGAPRQPASSGSTAPADAAPASEPASARPSRPQTRAATAPVTEWAVASIPTADAATPAAAPAAPLAVDDEPEEVEAASAAPTPPADGRVDRDEPPLPGEDDAPAFDEEPPYDPAYEPPAPYDRPPSPRTTPTAAPQAAARTAPAAAPPVVIERTPAAGGVQRYGEAVIRQVLGATFLREEPYEPPTRFS
ncbi:MULTISPECIES: DNA polymerase III subunit gamma and tau [unclassified Microbacterium]|uniref:DNA polymerase III subunit gamma and tau n=1 Tax=unclassified Microbacterium TaxID=2609290 RepID=UPI0021A41A03|nr:MULTISPECIES: DNA polymerase III subunit gamma and tau [unclassified Microbacterium]MCT1363043.1 DNA polymerase III subunit gamma and tau [Microbacterium sp. p3-SID131]MCT1376971.1 DNA polymerase III subunit gamma and tau [Microbacterium sp. p3-SID337]